MRIGLARQFSYYLADNPIPPTLGDLMMAFNLHQGTAVGERIREARNSYGFEILHIEVGSGKEKRHCYVMPKAERERVKKTPGYRELEAGKENRRMKVEMSFYDRAYQANLLRIRAHRQRQLAEERTMSATRDELLAEAKECEEKAQKLDDAVEDKAVSEKEPIRNSQADMYIAERAESGHD